MINIDVTAMRKGDVFWKLKWCKYAVAAKVATDHVKRYIYIADEFSKYVSVLVKI